MQHLTNNNNTLSSTTTNNIDHFNDSFSLINAIMLAANNNKSMNSNNISIDYLINNISNYSSSANESDHPLKLNLNPFSLMNILICTPMLVLQLMTLPIFLIYPNYRNNVCFRILFTNGVTDCLQLAPMLMFAALNLITDQIPIWLQMICGSIVINAWNLLVMQHLLLAINRLIVILRARFLGSSLILDEETEAKLFNVAHAFCWTLFFVIIALHQTRYMGDLFFSGTSQFVFDISKPYTQTIREVFWCATVVMPIVCLIIYIVIIAIAKMSRISTRRNDVKATNGRRPPLLNDYERRLLVQAIILYVVMGLLIIAWNSFSSCDGEICVGKLLKIIPISLTRTNHVYLIQAPWMVYCGLNPILFLIMNREFRNRFQKLYGL
uniref:G-protein coupled receptors family 1 profile domain-containing protein n=1 Tax=Globodera rostochiensis TaxID=31243 RepID=A0A914IDX1_GLORO